MFPSAHSNHLAETAAVARVLSAHLLRQKRLYWRPCGVVCSRTILPPTGSATCVHRTWHHAGLPWVLGLVKFVLEVAHDWNNNSGHLSALGSRLLLMGCVVTSAEAKVGLTECLMESNAQRFDR